MLEVTLAAEAEAAVEISDGIVRRQPDGLVVVGDGAIEVGLFVESVAARHEGAGVVGLEPDCGVEIGNRAVQIVLHQPRAAAVGVGPRIIRIELDGFGKIVDRAGNVALGAQCHAAVVTQNGEVGRLITAESRERVQEVICSMLLARHCPVQRRSSGLSWPNAVRLRAGHRTASARRPNVARRTAIEGNNRSDIMILPGMGWARKSIETCIDHLGCDKSTPLCTGRPSRASPSMNRGADMLGTGANPKAGPSRWMTAGGASA